MKIIKLDKKTCNEIVSAKHYHKKLGIFWEGFGLIEDGTITGVCVFGQPSAMIQKHAFKDKDFRLYELTRLVVQSKTRNAPSFLIANAIKLLKCNPCAIISYADSAMNHCGIVYQATNWLYTGSPTACGKNVVIDGEVMHPSTLYDMGIKNQHKWAKEKGYELIQQKPKHRYFQFRGNKKQKREMIRKLRYDIVEEYPKCEKQMYDDGDDIVIEIEQPVSEQMELF
jgi:hypothetical protein